MTTDHLYATHTLKSPAQFAAHLLEIAGKKGFVAANRAHMDMADTFRSHGADVADEFDLHMIQLCKPDKAADSLQTNPERAILMPKFVMAFSRDQRTQIRFHHYCRESICAMVDDAAFPESLAKTYQTIIAMIDEAAAC
ncbi:DUF302 domain-containing protein [Desulfofustis limnaeus]|jgi:uncharacterized protein (DUF302 family)|uniref:DUF302 domain-containing protein n=1 Tax=Desulfofustis limnaeus TaxID=2740163 RepID=A0ABN6M6C5_9BACT|nr:DUF302 domain-containing protein [Desulfofustis limnaeus]MDX9895896.1 DUF302 domain-containing protein [Desulfofustis sp.]BDD88370.1 DUF302 domain-containing protein [Desulfofustis limnaeus]